MDANQNIVQKADFNPKITTYILLVVGFFLTISVMGIPLLLIWFLGLGQLMSKRYYKSLECTLTKKHLTFKKGVLFKVEKTIPLENIQDLTFLENPLLNYLNLKILKIETAGNSNPRGSDMKLIGIGNAPDFKDKVMFQRELLVSRNKEPLTMSQTSRVGTETLEVLKEIKNVLNDIQNKMK